MTDACEICTARLEELVEQYLPFLIRTVSAVTGRYVHVENDDSFSIALSAFAEAVEKYDPERGVFTAFAGLVIRSRLQTYLAQERRHEQMVSLDALGENGQEPCTLGGDQSSLREEIDAYKEELLKFGLTLETLADHAPSHQDTRKRAVTVAERASEDDEIVHKTYEARKLPVRAVARLTDVSEKIVKTSKVFILGIMLVFVRKLSGMMAWIRGTR